MNKNLLHRIPLRHAGALLVTLFTVAVYCSTLGSSIGYIDGGELTAVPLLLGIAHPTGYPLFTIAGRLFSLFPVFNEPAIRLNFLSLLFTAGGILVIYYLMNFLASSGKRLHWSPTPVVSSIFGALLFAFSETAWGQSSQAEVYSLHILLVGISLLTFLRAVFHQESNSPERWRSWILAAYCLGLSFTNHMTTILLVPAYLYLYLKAMKFSRAAFRHTVLLSLPFFLGVSVYLFLFVRAAGSPPLNWGNPFSFEKFFWHVSGKQYRVWMFTSAWKQQFNYFIETLPREFYYFPLLLSLLGAWRLLLTDRRLLLFFFILFATCVGYAVNYDIHDIDTYFLLAYLSLMLFASFGLVEIFDNARKHILRYTGAAVIALFIIAEISANYPKADESDFYLVEDYSLNILRNLPPNALIVSYQWDYFVSGSYYFQHIQKIRPDITIIDKELLRRSWYFDQLKNNCPEVYHRSKDAIDAFLPELEKFEQSLPYDPSVIEGRFNAMIDNFFDANYSDRPLFVTAEIESHLGASYRRIPGVLSYRLTRDTSYYEVKFPEIRYRPFQRKDKYFSQLHSLYANGLAQRGLYEQSYGFTARAIPYFDLARQINPDVITASVYEQLRSGTYAGGR